VVLRWPGVNVDYGTLDNGHDAEVRASLTLFGDHVGRGLAAIGVSEHDVLLSQPWNLMVVWDPQAVWCVFAPLSGGAAEVHWVDHGNVWSEATLTEQVERQFGWSSLQIVRLPHPGTVGGDAQILAAAKAYVAKVERTTRLAGLGDLTGVEHLEPQLRLFLEDHPDPDRNVFVMMRFDPSPQLQQVHAAIVDTLAARNIKAVRADGRDYTGDLWSNIEIYLTGCKYGIAVFEDINQRDFNPNVSLELGYMLGRRKRCLILKEKRLPRLPTDVVGKLYKGFDSYDIDATVSSEVGRWIDVDLGLKP
jgi:hypothetical protein